MKILKIVKWACGLSETHGFAWCFLVFLYVFSFFPSWLPRFLVKNHENLKKACTLCSKNRSRNFHDFFKNQRFSWGAFGALLFHEKVALGSRRPPKGLQRLPKEGPRPSPGTPKAFYKDFPRPEPSESRPPVVQFIIITLNPSYI